jgi:polyisoprenyl-teichoic acid--peptidoglycan teichoic acid transferase
LDLPKIINFEVRTGIFSASFFLDRYLTQQGIEVSNFLLKHFYSSTSARGWGTHNHCILHFLKLLIITITFYVKFLHFVHNKIKRGDSSMKKFFILYLVIIQCIFLASCNHNFFNREGRNTSKNIVDSFKKKLNEQPINFLLLGIDTREGEKSRTDSIIVSQYDSQNRSVKLASIMRDSFVRIPGYDRGYNKLNHAYYLGGEELLKETVEQNLGLKIDHVITIDFKGFVKVVETIAPEGIEVNVNRDIIKDMALHTEPGEQFLHGEQLLKYVRFRHDANSDFGRVERQQEVLLKIKDKFQKEMNTLDGFSKIPALLDSAVKYVNTDLKTSEMLTLASTIFLQRIDTVDTIRIPVKNGFTNRNVPYAGAVLQLDLTKNTKALNQFFSEPQPVNDND